MSWARAIELGIDGLEHALPTSPDLLEPPSRAAYVAGLGRDSKYMYRWFELADYTGPLIQQLVARMAARRIATNLTLVVNQIIYNIDDLDGVVPAAELRDVLPEVLASYRPQLEASATGWTPDDFARARAVFPKVLEFARLLHTAGVPMMIGTDAGGGTFYARELALHVEAGIPVWAVLRMATSDAAQIMRIGDRVGRLEPGYEADMTILDGDPIADIAAASRVYAVLNNGTMLEAEHLRPENAARLEILEGFADTHASSFSLTCRSTCRVTATFRKEATDACEPAEPVEPPYRRSIDDEDDQELWPPSWRSHGWACLLDARNLRLVVTPAGG